MLLFLFWPVSRLEIWRILDERTQKQFTMACICYISSFALAQFVRTSFSFPFYCSNWPSKYVKPGCITALRPVVLISSMDRALRPVIEKVRVRFLVKPEFFEGLQSTASVVYSTARIMFTFIQLLTHTQLDFQKCPPSHIIWRSL